MVIDPSDNSQISVAQKTPHHVIPPTRSLNPLLPSFVSTKLVVTSIPPPSPTIVTSNVFPSSSTPVTVFSHPYAIDEIQAINEKHSAIESKMDMLVASISGFIRSINTPSFSNSAGTASSN
ncbi:hypothetical protein RclHR1_20250005 [Rhizophagus clarus]|uniref:Uncharacterized protein n=1 Tax=Rhizophagus clarus TaxID=94130 RepID=A0A2Z6QR34_9GLOM|nr:hypothetical protein RclHR1_20250005 [Rhizophagus clarus]